MADELTVGKIVFGTRTVNARTFAPSGIGIYTAPSTLKDEIQNLKRELEAAQKEVEELKAQVRELTARLEVQRSVKATATNAIDPVDGIVEK